MNNKETRKLDLIQLRVLTYSQQLYLVPGTYLVIPGTKNSMLKGKVRIKVSFPV